MILFICRRYWCCWLVLFIAICWGKHFLLLPCGSLSVQESGGDGEGLSSVVRGVPRTRSSQKFAKDRKIFSFRSISVNVLNICHYSLFKWVMTAVFCNQEQCIDYAQHKEHSDYHHGDLCAGLLQQIDRSSIMVALTNENKQYSYCCESRSSTNRCIAD